MYEDRSVYINGLLVFEFRVVMLLKCGYRCGLLIDAIVLVASSSVLGSVSELRIDLSTHVVDISNSIIWLGQSNEYGCLSFGVTDTYLEYLQKERNLRIQIKQIYES